MPTRKEIGWPVDCIIETARHYVLGSYKYDGLRSGKLQYLNKETKEVEIEHSTSGTFHICLHGDLIYCANANDISVYGDNGLVAKIGTPSLNTYIDCSTYVAVSDTTGTVTLYDYELNAIKSTKVSNDTAWVVKEINGMHYVGTEEGWAYRYDTRSCGLVRIGSRRLGILDFIVVDGMLYISSYDDNVEVYDENTLEYQTVYRKTGSLWKMILAGEQIYAACMYDGCKIFDKKFNLNTCIPTGSICYGLWVNGVEFIWSSFYENAIFYKNLNSHD